MSSSSGTTVNQSSQSAWGPCRGRHARKGNWSSFNIAAMVVSFVVFWPLGLVVLFWIMAGRNVRDLPAAIKAKWQEFSGGSYNFGERSGNSVFNDFQQTQYDRINEIKHEIKTRSERFKEFKMDAKRRADQEEFNNFMASSPGSADR